MSFSHLLSFVLFVFFGWRRRERRDQKCGEGEKVGQPVLNFAPVKSQVPDMGPEGHTSQSKISTNLIFQHTVSLLSFHLENLTFLTFDIFRKLLVLIRLCFLSGEFFNFTLLIRSSVAHTPLCSYALDNLH